MPNRLAQTQSLYLQKHAENPIDWWPWCDEALQTAQQENKPIFLSVGYSSCHWCTVMEGEAFSDEAIAQYMNDNFLPIKVDREERPDLDSIYMQALQMMVGQGGWPLNVFLTPDDRVPFYGGTYFPVKPKYGRPGFLDVLRSLRDFYDNQDEKLATIKGQILENLQQSVQLEAAGDLTSELLQNGLEYSAGVLSADTPGPRFPMIPYADAALRGSRLPFDTPRYHAAELCLKRGMNLALGGIFDHVGGGFHRYTVDPTWTVPHFEKMLYDNGQIMEYLANLWSTGMDDPAFERAIAKTVEWLKREMTAPEGYFYAAQDADNFAQPDDLEPEEGDFYVWSYDHLLSLLGKDELTELTQQFTLTEGGNFEGKNVLQRQQGGSLPSTTEPILAKLFRARYGVELDSTYTLAPTRNNHEAKTGDWQGRIPPVTDTKMIVAWNSLMISGLAKASVVFQNPNYYVLATRAAEFVLHHQWVGDRLHRLNYDGSPHVLAQSEDYALLIKALLDLQQAAIATPPSAEQNVPVWLEQAVNIQSEFDTWLWSDTQAGYFNTASDASSDLVIRERSYSDSATPSANGIAAANLVRLALVTEDLSYLDRAEKTLNAFTAVMSQSPQACPTLFMALDWFQHPVLVRTSGDRAAELLRRYSPTLMLKVEEELPEGAIALVCEGLSCKEPAQSWEQALTQLQQAQSSGA